MEDGSHDDIHLDICMDAEDETSVSSNRNGLESTSFESKVSYARYEPNSSQSTHTSIHSQSQLCTSLENRLLMQQHDRRHRYNHPTNRNNKGRKMIVTGSQALLRATAPSRCASFVKKASTENKFSSRSPLRQNFQDISSNSLGSLLNKSSLRDHIIIDTQASTPSAVPSTLVIKRPIETKGTWSVVDIDTTISSPPPSARSLHTASIWNDTLFVFGGFDGLERKNDLYSFNFTTKTWKLHNDVTGIPPSPRDRHISVVYRNSLYIFGGFDGHARTNDLYHFDILLSRWTQILPDSLLSSIPSPRHSHSAVVYNDNLYVYGGYDGGYRNDVHKYSFSTNTWTRLDPSGRSPRPRYRATCVVHRDKCYLHGGHDGTRHLMDTHVYDFKTNCWTQVNAKGTPPLHRDSHVCAVYADSMIMFGGASGGTAMGDMHELVLDRPGEEMDCPVWRTITCTGDTDQRFCHAGVIYGDSFYILGGFNGTQRLGDFIKFEFNLDDLSYEVPDSTIAEEMRLLINNEAFSDITFMIEGYAVRAHKIMLLRSPYFRAMLTGSMIEAGQPIIYIEEVSYEIFLKVLEYLYTDQVEVQFESAMELFAAADLFDVPRLKAMCEKTMLEKICIENAASIFHAADAHSAVVLREKSLFYILKHFEPISKTSDFEEMARSNVDLVVEILRNR